MKRISTLVVLVLLVAGCVATGTDTNPTTTPGMTTPAAPSATTTGDPNATNGLANSEWKLVSFGAIGSETPVLQGTDVTLKFGADGTVGGSTGCNSFGGDYQVQGDALVLGKLNSTLRACVQDTLNQQEQRYLEALQSTTKYTLTADQLQVLYDDGKSALNYTRATTLLEPWVHQTVGGTWQISYPEGWTVLDNGEQESYVELTGPYGLHEYVVRLAYPNGVNASTLDAWVEQELAGLSRAERESLVISDTVIAGVPARRISNMPDIEGTQVIEAIYLLDTADPNPRLISVAQMDAQATDTRALRDFTDRFIAQMG